MKKGPYFASFLCPKTSKSEKHKKMKSLVPGFSSIYILFPVVTEYLFWMHKGFTRLLSWMNTGARHIGCFMIANGPL
jgi:hypothetical protein